MQHSGSYFPDQGLKLCPVHWDRRVLTTGPPGNSSMFLSLNNFTCEMNQEAGNMIGI